MSIVQTSTTHSEFVRKPKELGKGGLSGNVIRTGMMLNSTKDHVGELIEALDVGFTVAQT